TLVATVNPPALAGGVFNFYLIKTVCYNFTWTSGKMRTKRLSCAAVYGAMHGEDRRSGSREQARAMAACLAGHALFAGTLAKEACGSHYRCASGA
ncbi:hypothetical protein, partial [Desulfovibrio sp.]|uniref:hypothetical protein n=1 Tax=Desulfovibrio sp. TaxID=885 RepID=UPI00307E582E